MVKEIIAKIKVSGVNFWVWSVGEKGLFELINIKVPTTISRGLHWEQARYGHLQEEQHCQGATERDPLQH
jgi:hypothetical protein